MTWLSGTIASAEIRSYAINEFSFASSTACATITAADAWEPGWSDWSQLDWDNEDGSVVSTFEWQDAGAPIAWQRGVTA